MLSMDISNQHTEFRMRQKGLFFFLIQLKHLIWSEKNKSHWWKADKSPASATPFSLTVYKHQAVFTLGPITELSPTTLTTNGLALKPQLILPRPHKHSWSGKKCCSRLKWPGHMPSVRETLFSFVSTTDSFEDITEVMIFPSLRCWESLVNYEFQCAGSCVYQPEPHCLQKKKKKSISAYKSVRSL